MTWIATLPLAIAVGIIGVNGGRAQLLVACLSWDLGRSEGLLLSALITSSATMALAVWLGWLAGGSFGELALRVMAAIAMFGAAVELLWPVRLTEAEEPTRSLGAISLVLFVRQLVDAPRLIIFAAATQLHFTPLLGLGGALGAGLCLWFGWQFGDVLDRRFSAVAVRLTLGLISLVISGLLASEAVSIAA